MAGISSRALAFGNPENKKNKFQDQELNNDLGVNYYEFKWRHHDYQIGRFIQIDPLAGDYPHNSTYAFSENRVINGIELEGLEHVITGYSYNANAMEQIQATARKSTMSDVERKQKASTEIDAIPLVGDGKGLIEAFTGKDMVTGEKLSAGSRLMGLFFLSEFRMIGKMSDALKSGKWVDAGESMSDAASSYQKQITGADASKSFKIDDVKFDGVTAEGVLLDAKSGMENFVGKDGAFKSWFKGADGLVDQANSQLKAANGAPVQWHFENKGVMEATQNLFKEKGIKGIEFIHTERKSQ